MEEEKEKEKNIKSFKTWLILNYKTGIFRVIKKKTRTLNPSEIAIAINLNVEIPEEQIIQAVGSIKLSSSKLAEMTLEELEA